MNGNCPALSLGSSCLTYAFVHCLSVINAYVLCIKDAGVAV